MRSPVAVLLSSVTESPSKKTNKTKAFQLQEFESIALSDPLQTTHLATMQHYHR